MMSSKRVGLIVAVVGVLVGLLFALADLIGFGRSPGLFGTNQIIGTVVGVLIFVAGVVIFIRSRRRETP